MITFNILNYSEFQNLTFVGDIKDVTYNSGRAEYTFIGKIDGLKNYHHLLIKLPNESFQDRIIHTLTISKNILQSFKANDCTKNLGFKPLINITYINSWGLKSWDAGYPIELIFISDECFTIL